MLLIPALGGGGRGREAERQRGREAERQRGREAERQRGRGAERQRQEDLCEFQASLVYEASSGQPGLHGETLIEKQMKNKGVPDFKTDTPDIMHYLRGITSLS